MNLETPRPTGVLAFAVLHLLFGISGIGGAILIVVMMTSGIQAFDNPLTQAAQQDATFRTLNYVIGAIDTVFAGILIAAGVGLLKMATWGRTLSLLYAGYKFIAVIVSSILNVLYVFLPVVEQRVGPENEQMVLLIASLTGGLGGCLRLIYPLAIVIYFGAIRKNMRAT